MDLGLSGERVVVTGAARNIGLGIAQLLAEVGMRVIAVDADADALAAAPLAASVERVVGDVLDEDLAPSLLADGPIPYLVSNATYSTPRSWRDVTLAEWERTLATNVPVSLLQPLSLAMADAGHGSIVAISSLHARIARRHPHYGAAKAAIEMLVREMALELGPQGVRVNAVAPGWVPHEGDDPDGARHLFPLGRPATTDDIARATAFLLSPTWSPHVTGQALAVDGGLGLHTWIESVDF